MTSNDDLGGDPPCWMHLVDRPTEGDRAPAVSSHDVGAVVVDLDAVDTAGASGVAWALAREGDLNVNLVRLHAGDGVGAHVNDEVDALIVVRSGRGELTVDGDLHELRAGVVALVGRGARRSLRAGPEGLTYLSIHRRRGPLTIGRQPMRSSDAHA